jgi:hypothetical protein
LKPLLLFASAFAALLAGCSGGGTAPPISSQTSPLASATNAIESTAKTYTAAVPANNDLLYVSNSGTNTITVYKHDQQANTAPIAVIGGSKTGITSPGQLSEDAAGNLYVAIGRGSTAPASVLVFAHGANGNVAPIRRIAGPATELGYDIGGLTVDQSTGKIFVFDTDAPTYANGGYLLRFPPNANGNQAPFAHGYAGPLAVQLASDSTGSNIIDAHTFDCCTFWVTGVRTFQKQFAANTGPTVVSDILALGVNGVADDPTTKTYLVTVTGSDTTGPSGIMRFAEGTNGYGIFSNQPASFTPPVVSTITSDTCGGNLALGYLRNIYVVHNKATGGCPTDAVYVYNHDSSGNATPLRVLSGSATRLSSPVGIYEGK